MFKWISDNANAFVLFFVLGMALSYLLQCAVSLNDITVLLDEQRRMFTAATKRELEHEQHLGNFVEHLMKEAETDA